jgi:ATP-dependent Lon protease
LEIAKRFLLPRQTREHALTLAQLTIEESAVREIITRYTREAGVRQLERTLGKLARKVARRVATGKVEQVTVNGESVAEILGRPNVRPERLASSDQKGVATGMFYTPVGGDILFVEAATMKGKGSLVLTGQLGDVMKESAQAAWSYARSHAPELGIDPERFESDVHVHVPAGAIPKDGPSAGITIATALISNLSDRPVRRDVAMTGELTLTGRVLPIGGVKEKVLGAVRAGISTIILPVENEADLEDLPLDVRNKLEIHPVEDLSEVLSVALLGVQRALGQSDVASPKPAYRSEDLSH